MKKVASIFAMLLIAIVVTLSSCSVVTIVDAIHDFNATCPIDYGNGVIMKSAVLDDNGDAVFTIDAKQLPSEAIANDEMAENFKKGLENEKELVKLMKDSNTKLIIRINCSDDTVEFTYEATEL